MIQPIGHFRVWRELYSKPIWLNSTLEQQVILITLMAMANFKPNQWEWEGQQFDLKPGQFITSSESIIKCSGGNVSIQNVRTALKRFEKLGFLTNESTKRGRLITLVNWRDYQYVESEDNQVPNRELTESQPRANRELTTIEEGKKEEKVKEVNKENIYTLNFEELWKLYPNKKGKASTTKKAKESIYKIGYENMVQAIDNYKQDLELNTWKQPLNGSTFFNGRYEDYLKENYTPEGGKSNGNTRTNDNKNTEDTWGIEKFITRG